LKDYIDSGFVIVGTPDDAVAQIKRLQEKSGGFGRWLNLQGEWAPKAAILRNYELIASDVAPHFNGDRPSRVKGYEEVVTSDHRGSHITAEGQRLARERFDAQRAGMSKL